MRLRSSLPSLLLSLLAALAVSGADGPPSTVQSLRVFLPTAARQEPFDGQVGVTFLPPSDLNGGAALGKYLVDWALDAAFEPRHRIHLQPRQAPAEAMSLSFNVGRTDSVVVYVRVAASNEFGYGQFAQAHVSTAASTDGGDGGGDDGGHHHGPGSAFHGLPAWVLFVALGIGFLLAVALCVCCARWAVRKMRTRGYQSADAEMSRVQVHVESAESNPAAALDAGQLAGSIGSLGRSDRPTSEDDDEDAHLFGSDDEVADSSEYDAQNGKRGRHRRGLQSSASVPVLIDGGDGSGTDRTGTNGSGNAQSRPSSSSSRSSGKWSDLIRLAPARPQVFNAAWFEATWKAQKRVHTFSASMIDHMHVDPATAEQMIRRSRLTCIASGLPHAHTIKLYFFGHALLPAGIDLSTSHYHSSKTRTPPRNARKSVLPSGDEQELADSSVAVLAEVVMHTDSHEMVAGFKLSTPHESQHSRAVLRWFVHLVSKSFETLLRPGHRLMPRETLTPTHSEVT
eukprot:TRINITY_DN59963_c0_g1_i1.p1 TRINITY_DN59963_c0_g1~~TRINITY_DN59963_c0_g1_i1.p1  ORF type:complete len:511 (-),score=191.33 TRINITY_DN59963_c0_g1_i1:65-1597(-)